MDTTPEQWQQEIAQQSARFGDILSLGDDPLPTQLPDPFAVRPPLPEPIIRPNNPLDISDEEADQVHLGHGRTAAHFGAIASGMQRAVEIGKENGVIKKKRWPWSR